MAYFEIGFDYTKEGVGAFPQSEGMSNDYPYHRPDSVWNLGIDFNIKPNLHTIEVKNGAKMTDLLSVVVINSYVGIIVSEKVKILLEAFRLPKCHFYPADIVKNNRDSSTLGRYFLFMTTEFPDDYIDFEASKFFVKGTRSTKVRDIVINNARELKPRENLSAGESLAAEKVILKNDFCWDIFRIKMISGYIVSERLKHAIEEAGITGIRFEPVAYLVKETVKRNENLSEV